MAAGEKPATFDEEAVADFYKGKRIRIVTFAPPGGAFDFYSRLIARHMPRHVPGNPDFIVQNRTGAGGLIAARVVYAVEPKDGTVIVSTNHGLVLQQALGLPGVDFDHAKFNWLGSAHKPIGFCGVRKDSGITRIEEIIEGKEVHTAVHAPGSFTYDVPAVLNAALGTRFKLVPGYPGLAPVVAAVERKEAEAFCFADPFSPVLAHVLGAKDPLGKVIVTLHPSDHPMVRGAPPAESLAKTEEAKLLLRTVAAPLRMAFPWAAAPGVPPERVAALRQAMARTFADPRFIAEAEKAQAPLDFSTGEEVTQTVDGILNTPAHILAKLAKVIK